MSTCRYEAPKQQASRLCSEGQSMKPDVHVRVVNMCVNHRITQSVTELYKLLFCRPARVLRGRELSCCHLKPGLKQRQHKQKPSRKKGQLPRGRGKRRSRPRRLKPKGGHSPDHLEHPTLHCNRAVSFLAMYGESLRDMTCLRNPYSHVQHL